MPSTTAELPVRSGCQSTSSQPPHSRSVRPVYTVDQIDAYLKHIDFPAELIKSPLRSQPALAKEKEHGLPFVEALQRCHVTKVPFENLGLHYSTSPHATLDQDELYERMVVNPNGRGGHCMQMNGLVGNVLRSLGFQVLTTAARTNTACQAVAMSPNFPGPSYNPWDHMINIVTLSGERYLVDAGMGGFGPTVPLLLKEGTQALSLAPRNVRLIRGCLPEHISCGGGNNMWQFEVRNGGDDKPWIATYAFSETEFIQKDFDMINWYITADRRSFFTHKILVCKLVLDDSKKEIIGDMMLYENGFRKRVGGEVVKEIGCKSEDERVKLLDKEFGIKLTAQERRGIQHTMAEIM